MTIAQTTRIPGPYRADGNTVFALDHDKWFTIARANGARLTDAAQIDLAAFIAEACTAHDALLAERDRLRAALIATVCQLERAQYELGWDLPELHTARAALAQSDKGRMI